MNEISIHEGRGGKNRSKIFAKGEYHELISPGHTIIHVPIITRFCAAPASLINFSLIRPSTIQTQTPHCSYNLPTRDITSELTTPRNLYLCRPNYIPIYDVTRIYALWPPHCIRRVPPRFIHSDENKLEREREREQSFPPSLSFHSFHFSKILLLSLPIIIAVDYF